MILERMEFIDINWILVSAHMDFGSGTEGKSDDYSNSTNNQMISVSSQYPQHHYAVNTTFLYNADEYNAKGGIIIILRDSR